ncbi:MAG: UvrB/UvrC motif-containing protein [Vallitaleaceae bacterium]|jgi:protein arginine kinase activator|nr:UvrB/UvrC motif-containing protein [Vallitaleaceae bacterium]
MLCDHCRQRPATMVISQQIDGKQVKVYLCETCANENEAYMIQNNPFEQFMGGVFNQKKPHSKDQIKCNNCGMTIDEFRKNSKIGCSNCYYVFEGYLSPIFKQIHGSTRHTGKRPIKYNAELLKINQINNLKIALQEAIEVENYEQAAILRDEIKAVQKSERIVGD